ncbi:hypothetical protein D3C72_1697730 [compost metagenome]
MKRETTGAKNASAIENAPNRNEPPWPNSARVSCQMAWTREMSCCAACGMSMPGRWASTFMGMAWRSAPKPLCICAASERARARALGSCGHKGAPLWRSAAYSQMASESHTAKSPSSSTGTRPAGDTAPSRRENSSVKRPSFCSVKGMPAARRAIHGRMDQEE